MRLAHAVTQLVKRHGLEVDAVRGDVVAAASSRFPVTDASWFQVSTMLRTGITMSAALAEVGSMQTVTASVPPLPV